MTGKATTAGGTGTWPALGGLLHHAAVLLLPPSLLLLAASAWPSRPAANHAVVDGFLGLLLLSVFLPAAWLWARTRRLPAYQPRQPLASSLAFAAVCAAFGVSLNLAIVAVAGLEGGANQDAVDRALAQLPLWAQLGAFVLAGPWLEEFVFRRLLLGRFLAAGTPVLGLAITSVLFGLGHTPYLLHPDPWSWAGELLLYSAMGAVLGAVYWRTRRLSAAFVAHALINAVAIMLGTIHRNGPG
jgi:uncharacterized protein